MFDVPKTHNVTFISNGIWIIILFEFQYTYGSNDGDMSSGYVQDIFRSPQALWHTGSGARLGNTGGVQGGPPGPLTSNLILVSGYNVA